MQSRDKETTPLLWPHQPQFPGSGAFPAVGQFPRGQQYFNPNINYQYFTTNTQRPGTPPQNTKKIHHDGDLGKDPHSQFCALTGCPPTNAPPGFRYRLNEKTLYGRAISQVQAQNFTYQLTAALTNTLLLLQIVLGAALTGLGGSGVPSYVITLFGAANTIIAGIVAYLKSRGQPMRARMFRDDLERVVDEMENSEVMWLGIAKGVHGYDDIDTDAEVTVRSEVARLTRLLDKAIRTNTANSPDLYSAAAIESSAGSSGVRQNPFLALPAVGIDQATLANIPPVPVKDPDAAPATSSKSKKEEEEKKKKEAGDKAAAAPSTTAPPTANPAATSSTTTPAPAKPEENKTEDKGKGPSSPSATDKPSVSVTAAPKPPSDPDASPATNLTRKKSTTNTTTSSGSGGNTTTTTYRSSSHSGGGETTTFSSSGGFGSGLSGGFSSLLGGGGDNKTSEDSKNDQNADGKDKD